MPYVKKELRPLVDAQVDSIRTSLDAARQKGNISDNEVAALLTYTFFRLLRHYYAYDGAKWYVRADALKVCDSARREFERRFMDPYEQKKCEECDVE